MSSKSREEDIASFFCTNTHTQQINIGNEANEQNYCTEEKTLNTMNLAKMQY